MSGSYEKALATNVKLAKQFDKVKVKLKLVRDQGRDDKIKPTNDQIEKKIHQLSRADIEFYQERSMKTLSEQVDQVLKCETQMYEQLKGLIDEARRQCMGEKENVEANYSASLEKLGSLNAKSNGRKRKLNVSNC